MIRKGFYIDTQKLVIVRDVTYDDKVFDSFYVREVGVSSKEGANILFAAQTFPIEYRNEIQSLLTELAAKKKEYEDLQAKIFYREFPKYRGYTKWENVKQ